MLERSCIVKGNLQGKQLSNVKFSPYTRRPEPQKIARRKPMTIAAGFRCLDGVVICTDSEHTAGQAKFYDKKIFEIKARNAVAYLAGAGDYAYIRTAAEEIESYMKGKTVTLGEVKDFAKDAASEIYSGHIAIARQAGDPTLTLALLLAVKVREEPRAMLYRIAETGGLSNISSGVAAIGTEAGESMFRELADLL
jgi:20S proteasome alpha/beta subunit